MKKSVGKCMLHPITINGNVGKRVRECVKNSMTEKTAGKKGIY